MAVVSLVSGAGSPGTTTAALALALAWSRPTLLVEADPSGSSAIAAGWLRGNPPHNAGLLNLAVAARHGDLTSALRDVSIRLAGSTVDLIAGIRSPAQTGALPGLWEPLAAALGWLDRTGTDVVVDGGRLGLAAAPMPVLRSSDVVLLTTRSDLPAIAAARGWAGQLREEFAALGLADHLGLLVIGEGRPYGTGEISKALGLPVVATLAWHPAQAQTYSHGRPARRGRDRGALARSVRAAVSAVAAKAATNRARLAADTLAADTLAPAQGRA